jgi:hypothetical protein
LSCIKAKDKAGLLWDLTEEEIRSAFPQSESIKGSPPTSENDPFDRLPPDLRAVRLWCDVRLWNKWVPAAATADSMLSWRKEFLREFEETDGDKKPLGALPVIVVASGDAASESERHSRNAAAARLGFLSTNTKHITAAGSGHEIHLYQPDVLARALAQAVSALRLRSQHQINKPSGDDI